MTYQIDTYRQSERRQFIVLIQQEGQATVLGGTCDLADSASWTDGPSAVKHLDANGTPCGPTSGKKFPVGLYTATAKIFNGQSDGRSDTPAKTTTQTFDVVANTQNKSTVMIIDGAALSK